METPRQFDFTQLIPAGATFNPLDGWQYETPEQDVMVELLERATATGLVSSLTSGGDTIKQESSVQAGGTAGTTPARLTTEPKTGRGKALLKLRAQYRNPTAGGITIDGTVSYVPLHKQAGPRRAPRRPPPGFGFGGFRRPRKRK